MNGLPHPSPLSGPLRADTLIHIQISAKPITIIQPASLLGWPQRLTLLCPAGAGEQDGEILSSANLRAASFI